MLYKFIRRRQVFGDLHPGARSFTRSRARCDFGSRHTRCRACARSRYTGRLCLAGEIVTPEELRLPVALLTQDQAETGLYNSSQRLCSYL